MDSPEHVEKKGSVGGYGVSADAVPRDHLNIVCQSIFRTWLVVDLGGSEGSVQQHLV